MKKATIYDVAARAQVSHQTVSRVLNNHPSLKPATRQKVEKAIADLMYRPSQAARQLVTSKSDMIGMIVADTNLYGPTSIRNAMENETRNDGYTVTSVSFRQEDRDSWIEGVEHLKNINIDGLITVALPKAIVEEVAKRIPSALLVVVHSEPSSKFDVVNIDNEIGGQIATDHLIALGHKRIAHVSGPKDSYESAMRQSGYEASMKKAKLKTEIIRGDWSIESGYKLGLQIADMKDRPTAIFCANDHQSLGLLKAFSQKKVRVPEDLSLVGFDDIPESEFFSTALTTVKQDFDELGKIAVTRLLSQLKEKKKPILQLVEPTLVTRDSTQQLKAGKK